MELAGHKCVGFCEFDKYAVASYTSMHLITDKQRKYLSGATLKQRQRRILREEYRNGEWYADDIRRVCAKDIPAADCWTFGAPCQDFSIAGKRAGLDGDRSSLIREIFRLLEEQKEEDRPEWLIYENVKGMFSSNKGLDYLSILSEMDRLGYDCEWQNINSKWFVPQNRERIYTIGHLRRFGSRKVFPITGADGENSVSLIAHKENGEPMFTLTAQDRHGVGIKIKEAVKQGYSIAYEGDSVNFSVPGSSTRRGRVGHSIAQTLDTSCNQGIFVQVSGELTVYAIWYEKYQCYIAIRKLTPKECFRLQGWTDDYFECAAFVNSDSQLYKQAGNGVTVNVIQAIGQKLQSSQL